MVGVVIGDEEDLAEVRLPGAVRDGCEEIDRGIARELPQLLAGEEHERAPFAVHARPEGAVGRALDVDELETEPPVETDRAGDVGDVEHRGGVSGRDGHLSLSFGAHWTRCSLLATPFPRVFWART